MKTRKRLGVLLGLGGLVLAAAAVIGGLLIARNYVFLDGRPYSVQSETLDLSGMQNPELEKLTRFPQLKSVDLRDTHITLEEHSHLAAALPECSISWQVPFHGEYLELDTQSVSITTVLPEDAEALAQLPALETVDCTGCEDLEMLARLRKGLPECEVLYTLCLDGQTLDQDTKELRLEHVDLPALRRALPCLPGVERLTAVDWTPEPESVDSLRKEFPGIGLFFEWDDRLLSLDEETTALDLNGWPLTAAAAEGLLGCFPKLEQAKMLDTGLTDEELFALCDAFPNCEFLWEASFGPVRALTDVEEIDISDYPVEDPAWVESLLPYFPRLQKVVMCRCGLDNETMNALNRRHEDVNFVWEVSVGVVKVRTDTDYFAPVVTGRHVYEGEMDNLKYCPDIIAVDVGHMGLKTCDWARYMPKLQYLIIADSGISDISALAECKELIFLEMFLTPVKDYSPLLSCKKLEDLNMCYTYGDPEPISKMTWLKRLWWTKIPYTYRDMAQYLPDTQVVLDSGSSTGYGWRDGAHYKEQRDILGMSYLVG